MNHTGEPQQVGDLADIIADDAADVCPATRRSRGDRKRSRSNPRKRSGGTL